MEGENTILDRVMSSKRAQEMEGFRPAEVVTSLLKELTDREEDVLRRRFGLNGKDPQTLEEIGALYHVTRERIRQIQNTGIQRLRKLKGFASLVGPIVTAVVETLSHHGGVMAENELFRELFQLSAESSSGRQAVRFIMLELMTDKVEFLRETPKTRDAWRLKSAPLALLDSTIDALETFIRQTGAPIPSKGLLELFKAESFFKDHTYQLTDDAILATLGVSRMIAANPFGEYGLTDWGTIQPKRMNDKIYLILKREGKPLHFTEITKRINETHFDDRVAYAPTVHNELILNKQYVLVGRGMYALEEWGYKPGVVADVIEQILRERGTPLSRQELVEAVMKQRFVKRNTIHLALTDRGRFVRLPNGAYTLAAKPT